MTPLANMSPRDLCRGLWFGRVPRAHRYPVTLVCNGDEHAVGKRRRPWHRDQSVHLGQAEHAACVSSDALPLPLRVREAHDDGLVLRLHPVHATELRRRER